MRHEIAEVTSVPMNPEYLPEGALLLAALFTGAYAVHLLLARQLSRAIRTGAASVICIVLAIVLAKTFHNPPKAFVLVPAARHSIESMSLVLGDVILQVSPSDEFEFSVDGKKFLELDLRRSKLSVSGVVGTRNRATTSIRQNTFPFSEPGFRPARPDAHTLLVQEEGRNIFRIHFSDRRRLEVNGQFFEKRSDEGAIISLQNGIHWKGGDVPAGTLIDLRDQGRGRISFETGLIRILPGG
jgi:hypothetical protein